VRERSPQFGEHHIASSFDADWAGLPEQVRSVPAPSWQARIAAACVTLACGGAGTGIRSKMTLMHPITCADKSLFDALAQKMAFEILIEVIMAACEVHPPLSASIERRLDELLSSELGLRERDDKSRYLAE
jgi:hypothetical protein